MLLFTSLFSQGDFGQPPLPGPHRYWRVLINANQSLDQSAILELEMYATKFGLNLCTGGTASASSEAPSGNYPPADAFDQSLRDIGAGSSDDLWASDNTAPPHWLAYDFGAGNDVEINAIGMFARQPTWVGQTPSDFSVQYSDDAVAWTTAWSETGVTWTGFEFKRCVNPSYGEPPYSGSPHGAHAYWRLHSMRADNDDAVALAEMEFRATPGGADQATGGTPSASSIFSGSFPASAAFDDDGGTLWSAANGSNWAWLQYQFGSAVEVTEVVIAARDDVAAITSPGEFAFQYSDDGVTWTTAWALVGETSWSLGETRTYTDPNYVP